MMGGLKVDLGTGEMYREMVVCDCPSCTAIENRITWEFRHYEIGFPSDPDDGEFESERVGPWHGMSLEYRDMEKGHHLRNAVDFPEKVLTEERKEKGKQLLRVWLKEQLYRMKHEEKEKQDMGGFKYDWMVSWKYKSVICAFPLSVRFGNSDYSRMRTTVVQILILRLSYSWVKEDR